MQKKSKIKIAQITDIHIGPEDVLYNNINVRDNFLKVLQDVESQGPYDAVILSGDLAIDFGEIEAYYWIKETLKGFPYPLILMSGNHDSIERMERVFNLEDDIKNEMLYFERWIGGYPFLFLDSEPDVVHSKQLEWLKEKSKEIDQEIILFIHHPPLEMQAEFMDRKYPLRNADETFAVILECSNIHHIFCGHYHSEGQREEKGRIVYTAPATQMQIDKKNHDFEISDLRPGWRLIEWDGNEVKTEVRYVD